MKTKIRHVLFALMLGATTLTSCKPKVLHAPYTITEIKEGDGCCDIFFTDVDGNKSHKCTEMANMKRYHQGDVLQVLPF